jgi:hypothetical protein
MRTHRAALLIIGIGLLTFGVIFTLLEVTRSEAAPNQPAAALAVPAENTLAVNSFGLRMAPGEIAVGVPTAGSEPVFRALQPGARIDVLASVPSRGDGGPLTAVVVRGATVLRLPVSPDPLLVKVDAADAIVLAHLILSGTHLDFAAWPTNAPPPPQAAMDERTARALLGLPALPEPTVVAPTLVPVAAPSTPTPVQTALAVPNAPIGGFIYQAQAGDTWDSVATTFNLLSSDLRQWNEASAETELVPGTLLFVPRR